MPKVIGGIAALLLATGLLAGCAATAPEEEPEATPTASAPLVAESPAEESYSSAEEEFLAKVRPELESINTVIPNATDEQLLTAAAEACEAMASGTDSSAVQVIEGEEPNGLGIHESSAKIAGWAAEVGLCN